MQEDCNLPLALPRQRPSQRPGKGAARGMLPPLTTPSILAMHHVDRKGPAHGCGSRQAAGRDWSLWHATMGGVGSAAPAGSHSDQGSSARYVIVGHDLDTRVHQEIDNKLRVCLILRRLADGSAHAFGVHSSSEHLYKFGLRPCSIPSGRRVCVERALDFWTFLRGKFQFSLLPC